MAYYKIKTAGPLYILYNISHVIYKFDGLSGYVVTASLPKLALATKPFEALNS
jgi:hypothetical protein